jgi:hypothetical protein
MTRIISEIKRFDYSNRVYANSVEQSNKNRGLLLPTLLITAENPYCNAASLQMF